MKWIEKILIVLFIAGLFMKFNIVPGGNVLILLSLGILAFLYFYLGFIVFNNINFRYAFKKYSYKGISGLRLTFTILAGVSISFLAIGILFKLLYWPGASINLLAGITTSLIILIAAVIKFSKNRENIYRLTMIRIVPFIVAACLFITLSKQELMGLQYRNHPLYLQAKIALEEDPGNEEKIEKENLERDRMMMAPEEFKTYHPEAE